MPKEIPYRFHKGDPGTFVEIYLPKKALYQGKLYNTLTNGFRNEGVLKHFRKNKEEIGIVQKCVPGDNLAERISMLK